MSLGLIGKYDSDSNSSISDSDEGGGECYDPKNSSPGKDAEELPAFSDPLSLGLEDSTDSDDSNSETNSVCSSPSKVICTPLPLPDIDSVVAKNPSYSKSGLPTSASMDGGQTAEENSVFFNPFKKAEEQRLAILKHHVQEFDKKPQLVREDMSHRGTRRGYHGSLHSVPPPRTFVKYNPQEKTHHIEGPMGNTPGRVKMAPHSRVQMQNPNPTRPHHSGAPWEGTPHGVGGVGSFCGEEATENELFGDDDSSSLVKRPRKHRSGVTDSLIPPKKFMKSHEKIQAKERPWTLK